MSEKKRLDVLLCERGLAPSREKARAMIMSGDVLVDEERCDKAGASVAVDALIRLKVSAQTKYVSRGGLKIEKAMEMYGLKLDGRVVWILVRQLADSPIVCAKRRAKGLCRRRWLWSACMEPADGSARCQYGADQNIRYVTHEQVPEELDFASVDVSFISLTLVLASFI